MIHRLKGPGRAIQLELTDSGRAALAAAARDADAIEDLMRSALTDPEAEALAAALKRCRNALV